MIKLIPKLIYFFHRLTSYRGSSGRVKISPDEFYVNNKDNSGDTIKKIYYKSIDYVVYRTKGAIRIDIDDDSPNLHKLKGYHGVISVDLARIYSWLPAKLNWSEPINRQIARALAENAQGNHEEARDMLSHAEVRIKSLRTIKGRLQYTLSGFAVALLSLIFLVLLDINNTDGNTLIDTYQNYASIASSGALGGIISIFLWFPRLEIDIDADKITNCLAGGSRILISMSAAVFSYFALKSGLAFSFIDNNESSDGVYVVAMLAGFSEMLVPNIMANLVGEAPEKSKSDSETNEVPENNKGVHIPFNHRI